MFSKLWLINVILFFLFAFLALKAYGVWFHENTGEKGPKIPIKSVQASQKPLAALPDRKIPPETAYDDLINLNLFHPDRTETVLVAPKPDAKARKLSAKEKQNIDQYFSALTLYGLVITHDSAEALVSYPVLKSALQSRKSAIPKNRRRNVPRISAKENKWVKVGDTLGDFKVESIQPDRVVLKTGETSYDLLLYDKEKPKKREVAKAESGPNIVGAPAAPKTAVPNENKKTKPSLAKWEGSKMVPARGNPSMEQKDPQKKLEKDK
jgi:hypothetical protein